VTAADSVHSMLREKDRNYVRRLNAGQNQKTLFENRD
jgi:hypothetical protein